MLVVLLLYALAHFAAARLSLYRAQERRQHLEAQAEALRLQAAALQQQLDSPWDDSRIEAEARQRLGLVMPGETVYYFITEDRED